MVQTSLSLFDLIVLGVVGMSALLSFFRGFVREVLSLGTWVGASIITLYTFPIAEGLLKPSIKNEAVAGGVAAIGIFLVSLIVISLFTRLLLKFLKPSKEIGLLDNMIGLLFGVARGVLLVSVGYFIMMFMVDEKKPPEWMKGSMTRPYVAESSKWVAKLAPGYLNDVVQNKDAKAKFEDKQVDTKPVTDTIEELQKRMREENEKD